jgi:hypothetical protein
MRTVDRFAHLESVSALIVVSTIFVSGCSDADVQHDMNDASEVHQALMQDGLSCEVQDAIQKLRTDEFEKFSELLASTMSGDEFMELARAREIDCIVSRQGDIATSSQPLAGYNDGHSVESIEDDSIGGSSVQTTGWEVDPVGICGSDLNDGIWEVNNLPYSHQFREYLRYTGTDSFGSCIESLSTAMDARVYYDNSIRMCVRSTWLGLCDNWYVPHDYSLTIGFQ